MSKHDVSWRDAFASQFPLQFNPSKPPKLIPVLGGGKLPKNDEQVYAAPNCFFFIDETTWTVWRVELDGTTSEFCRTGYLGQFYHLTTGETVVTFRKFGGLMEVPYGILRQSEELYSPSIFIRNYTGTRWKKEIDGTLIDCLGQVRATLDPRQDLPVYYSETGPVWGFEFHSSRNVIVGPNQFLSLWDRVSWKKPTSEYFPGLINEYHWESRINRAGFIQATGFRGLRVLDGLIYQGRTYLLVRKGEKLYVATTN